MSSYQYERELSAALDAVRGLHASVEDLEHVVLVGEQPAAAIERCAQKCRQELDRIQKRFVPRLLELDTRSEV